MSKTEFITSPESCDPVYLPKADPASSPQLPPFRAPHIQSIAISCDFNHLQISPVRPHLFIAAVTITRVQIISLGLVKCDVQGGRSGGDVREAVGHLGLESEEERY